MILIHKYARYLIVAITMLALPSLWAAESEAEPEIDSRMSVYDQEQANLYKGNKFAIGVGLGVVKFDTNVKIRGKNPPTPPLYIGLEGSLDLPEVSHVTNFYGAYSFNARHMVMFSYFGINRSSSLLSIDEEFEEVYVVNAQIDINDKTSFYNLTYGYSMFYDDRSQIKLVLGLNGMDLRLTADARGEIRDADGALVSFSEIVEAEVFAPLPLIGLNVAFRITPRWGLATAVSLVSGSYGEVSATALQTEILARYFVTRHIGLLIGMTYFNTSIDINKTEKLTQISYGYTGASIGMHFSF